jgi:hypothetical protein
VCDVKVNMEEHGLTEAGELESLLVLASESVMEMRVMEVES